MLFIDTETYNEKDISTLGTVRHAETCEVLLVTYALGPRGEPKCWDVTLGEPMPDDLYYALSNHEVELCAHHSLYDRHVLKQGLGVHTGLHRWHDTMVLAYTAGLPGKLGMLGPIVGTPEDQRKNSDGKRLIQLFAKPRPKNHKLRRATRETHPEDWARFIDYALSDIRAMQQVWLRVPHRTYDHQRRHWLLDQRIADRGVRIDVVAAHSAVALVDHVTARLNEAVAEATGGELKDVGSRQKVLHFLDTLGVSMDSYAKDAVSAQLDSDDLPEVARLVLETRRQTGRSSTAKYAAMLNAVSGDGRLRGALQFYGAQRTGREAGRRVQPQNMPRADIDDTSLAMQCIIDGDVEFYYDDPMGVAASCVRAALIADPGCRFIVSDLANIEGRVVAWLAGEEWKLRAFAAYDAGRGPDLYKLTYASGFGVDVDDVTKAQRQVGKVMELSMGFGGGVGAFQNMATNYGVRVTDEKADELKKVWRELHPKIVLFWESAEEAVKAALRNPGARYPAGEHILVVYRKPFLLVGLPNGRVLHYYNPRLKVRQGYWKGKRWLAGKPPEGTPESWREEILYWGKEREGDAWGWQKTYGGKLCIAEDTLVVTEFGAVPIQDVRPGWRVWDGEEWVSQEGAVCNGTRPVIEAHGVQMTEDHPVLTTEGWVNASQSKRHDRFPCRVPDCGTVLGLGRQEVRASAPVYDLINCGPRHRFVVLGKDGAPLIVHNCENWTQAVSRDVLFDAMPKVEASGYPIVLHTHDELVTERPAGEGSHEELSAILASNPPWCQDLPLAAEGFESFRYRK